MRSLCVRDTNKQPYQSSRPAHKTVWIPRRSARARICSSIHTRLMNHPIKRARLVTDWLSVCTWFHIIGGYILWTYFIHSMPCSSSSLGPFVGSLACLLVCLFVCSRCSPKRMDKGAAGSPSGQARRRGSISMVPVWLMIWSSLFALDPGGQNGTMVVAVVAEMLNSIVPKKTGIDQTKGQRDDGL